MRAGLKVLYFHFDNLWHLVSGVNFSMDKSQSSVTGVNFSMDKSWHLLDNGRQL